MASIRQRKELKRWAKGKLIKVRYQQEFSKLGWIASRLIRHECGCYMEYYLTLAGRAVIGNAIVSVPEEVGELTLTLPPKDNNHG